MLTTPPTRDLAFLYLHPQHNSLLFHTLHIHCLSHSASRQLEINLISKNYYKHLSHSWSQGSFSVVRRLRAEKSGVRIPAKARDLSPHRPHLFRQTPSFLFYGYNEFFPQEWIYRSAKHNTNCIYLMRCSRRYISTTIGSSSLIIIIIIIIIYTYIQTYSALGQSLCSYARCWKWSPRASTGLNKFNFIRKHFLQICVRKVAVHL
jgi:hypothetical protein